MKLKEYIKHLNDLVRKYPKAIDMEVVYSIDDEGNAYNKVTDILPSLLQVENLLVSQDIEVVGILGDETIVYEDCNAVCIN